MDSPFTWGEGGVQMTPDRIAAQRKIAEALLAQGSDTSPVKHWTQGAARVAQTLLGSYDNYAANKAEVANRDADQKTIAGLLMPQAPTTAAAAPIASAPPEVASPTGPPPPAQIKGTPIAPPPSSDFMPNVASLPAPAAPAMDANAKAIAGIESGGRYDLLGPATRTGDRAYGKYQVMGSNVGPWTKQYYGQELTPDQFRTNPDAQEAVFKGEFGRLAAKHGPEGAARAWFAGEGGMNEPGRKDVLGTTVAGYGQKFASALGGAPAAPSAPPPAAALPAPMAAPPAAPPPAQPSAPPATSSSGMAGVDPKLVAALTSPYASDSVKKIAMVMLQSQMADKVTYQTTPDGDILAMDPHGRAPPKVVYQATPKPISVAENAQLWDPRTRTFITPSQQGGPVTGPDGKPIAIPPGVDPKEFKKRVTEATADAATGKKTEVQAKDEKFANKMELAEKNVTGLEGEGTSRISRGLDAKIPWTNTGVIPFSNSMQSDNYQKYRQGRDNFITALLRDESGAAIGSEEFQRYERELFPQPGDGQPVIEQKREARRIAIEAMKKGAGPGYKSPTQTPDSGPSVDDLVKKYSK